MKQLTLCLFLASLGLILGRGETAVSAVSTSGLAKSAAARALAPQDEAMSLKDAIVRAMKQNPDLRLAEAKLSEAQAERDRVRLEVTRDLVRCHEGIAAARVAIEVQTNQLALAEQRYQQGAVPRDVIDKERLDLVELEMRLKELLADRSYLVGGRAAPPSGAAAFTDLGPSPEKKGKVILSRPELTPALRALLDAKVSIEARDQSLAEFMTNVTASLGASGFTTVFDTQFVDAESVVAWRAAKAMSVRALFEWLSDQGDEPLAFVFRDYGIYVTIPDRAVDIAAPCYPALPLYEIR